MIKTYTNKSFIAVAAFFGMLTTNAFAQEAEPCYGQEVLNFEQGPQTNGQPVAADRSDPEVTLGEPSLNNSAGNFFSLGVGGFIEIGFGGIVLDQPGNDLLVVETSFSGNNCGFNDDEFADIELSDDGINWVFYGTICRNEEIDIAETGLAFITAIRITNSPITTTLDGYDVDGVIALNGCEDFPVVEEECYGHSVLLYEPGEGNIPANRMDPEQALGAPERDNTINFVSLGFGGTLILGFEDAAIALPGQDDLEVVETTFGSQTCESYEERADVYVSQQVVSDASEIDDALFVYVGESCTNGEFFDVYAETGFEYFTLVKIVDVTPEAAQFPNRDGYDVDGIVALHGCQPVPELEIGDEPCEGTWRTQTQGGWGAPANGNNPGVYRDANFDAAFPNGLAVGCEDGFNLTLTSAAAVQAFLPSGGQPSALSANLENPTNNQGSFAGNLTALALSLGFDANDSEFSDSDFPLANLVINSGSFEGLTVGELFELASDVFGGCNTDYAPSQLNAAVDAVNNAFSGGNSAGNEFVGCPQGEEITEDPYCTNGTVFAPEAGNGDIVRLTAMGFYQECTGEYGFRWRIRNETSEPASVVYTFAGNTEEESAPFHLEPGEAVFFTTGFGNSPSGGGTMIIKDLEGNQLDVKAHGGSIKDLAECSDAPCLGDQLPGGTEQAVASLTTYPNPSAGIVNVEFTTTKQQMVTIEVVDLSGRVVAQLFRQNTNDGQNYRLEFNGTNLPNGLYITRMTTESEIIIEKIMIAR
jgi:hypothetical protein